MLWGERATKFAGIAMLFLAVAVIADAVIETVVTGDADALARGDLEALLRDINNDESLFFIGSGIGVLADSVALLAVAAMLWLLLRDRAPALAMLGLSGLVVASASFLFADAAAVMTGVLAADYLEHGGAGGIAAGDPAILSAARTSALMWSLTDLIGLVVLSLGLISYSSVLAWAPEGEVNPPRWLGVLGAASSLAMLFTWTFVLEEAVGLAIGGIGLLGAILFIISLGAWLVTRPEQDARPSPATPAPARP